LAVCRDPRQQAAFVAYQALRLHEEGTNLGRMAVLYRSHFHAVDLQMELTRRHIPFSITSGIRFFEQAHLKDVAAYLKFISNPRDEIVFRRLVQLLPGVGKKAADKLWQCFDSALAAHGPEFAAPKRACCLQSCASKVPRKATTAWAQFVATIAQLETTRGNPSDMIGLILEAGYEDYVKQELPHARSRLEDLDQFALYAQRFETAEELLTELALLSNVDAEDDHFNSADGERLRLSTIHQSKGLEFDVVFLIMLCEGFFPTERSLRSTDSEEEERRLMYVAITRARDELFFSYPLLAGSYRSGGQENQAPSHFLEEIPKALLEEQILHPHA
jgi:DNA helicase II / ATP-dependent DNA helicase PcrA